ncbi:hypothetical protein SEA_CELAENA_32 [Microbacterium phage Celaena]|nr:hypothetical protein QDW17_gp32 [Microbacterium phage Celaena]QDH92411.1 hypothetical protein SEA_CELAENA_32 [Microbacterium phage Celaena]
MLAEVWWLLLAIHPLIWTGVVVSVVTIAIAVEMIWGPKP